MRFTSGLLAGLAVVSAAGVASAQAEIPGTFTFGGDASGSLERTGTFTLPKTGGNRGFLPTTTDPLLFSQIGNISADFEILDSSTSGVIAGSPRVTFGFDDDFDGVAEASDADGVENSRAVLSFSLIDARLAQTEEDDVVPTGNLIGLNEGEFQGFPGGSGTGQNVNYSDILAAVGDARVVNVFVRSDGGGTLDAQFSDFSITFAPVPEPASLGLLAAGGLMLRRRRA